MISFIRSCGGVTYEPWFSIILADIGQLTYTKEVFKVFESIFLLRIILNLYWMRSMRSSQQNVVASVVRVELCSLVFIVVMVGIGYRSPTGSGNMYAMYKLRRVETE